MEVCTRCKGGKVPWKGPYSRYGSSPKSSYTGILQLCRVGMQLQSLGVVRKAPDSCSFQTSRAGADVNSRNEMLGGCSLCGK